MNKADRDISNEQLVEWFSKQTVFHTDPAIYSDENIPLGGAKTIRDAGVRITTIYWDQRGGETSDYRILYRAKTLGCILLTYDADFSEIDQHLRGIGKLSHAGILLIESKSLTQDEDQLAQAIIRLAQKYEGFPEWLVNQVYKL